MNKEERKLTIYWYWFNHKQERTDTKALAAKFRTTEDNVINIISWGLKFSEMKRMEEERIKAPDQEPSFVRDYNPEEEIFTIGENNGKPFQSLPLIMSKEGRI